MSNSLTIFDDSPVLASCLAKWVKSAMQCETVCLLPGADWRGRLESQPPFALIIDATSQRIPADEVVTLLCSDARFSQTRVILSCGYADNLEVLLVNYAKRLGARCIAIRKPISQQSFTEQIMTFLNQSSGGPDSTTAGLDGLTRMKNIFGDKSGNSITDRFRWLGEDGAIMAFAITLPNGTTALQGGKDCGDLAQGGAYFRDLASQIGSEMGIEQLKELQVTCESCRLLSSATEDGSHVTILGGSSSDLPALSRAIKDSK